MSNVTLLQLRDRANTAAKHQLNGDKSHGTAGILAVATLVDGIRSKLFVERVEHNGKPVVMTFTTQHAMDCARLMYGRFNKECQTLQPLVDYYKSHSQIISTKDGADDWRDYIVALLVPYTYNNVTHEPRTTSKQVLKSFLDTPKEVAVRKAIEDVKYRRKVLTDAWPIACLYIARDMSGSLWMQSKVDTTDKGFGLWINASDFLPVGVDLVGKDRPALCKPLKGASVEITGNSVDVNTGGDKAVKVRASLGQFAKVWRMVEQSEGDEWKALFQKIADHIDRDWTIPANARKAFDAAYAAMVVFNDEVLKPAAARDVKKADTPEDAHDIANRENVTLKAS